MLRHGVAQLFFYASLLFPCLSTASSLEIRHNFLVLSDIHLDLDTTHSMEISPRDSNDLNDLDRITFENVIAELRHQIERGAIPTPEFMLILGDINAHRRPTADSPMKNESVVFGLLKKNFPNTPLLYTYGNNDSLQVKYGPFVHSDHLNPLSSPYDVAKTNGKWKDGFLSTGTLCKNSEAIFPCIITEDTTNGYYSAYIQPQFRLISLNSTLFSKHRKQTSEQDAMDHLQWLDAQLAKAEKQNESVLITMHIPPGNNIHSHSAYWEKKELNKFLKLVKKYKKTIVGMLAAHTHKEELKVIKDENNKIISGVYLNAALSTSDGNNPAVKTMYFSEQNGKWQLSNYDSFHIKTQDVSITQQSVLKFNKLYDYKQHYCDGYEGTSLFDCLSSLTPEKIQIYYTAGNPNFNGVINYGDDINVKMNP